MHSIQQIPRLSQRAKFAALTLVFPPSPRARAHTMVLFPVPLGPIIMFRLGPGVKEHHSYVTKLFMEIFTIDPCWYLVVLSNGRVSGN